jgi:hypothetical protein
VLRVETLRRCDATGAQIGPSYSGQFPVPAR